MSLRTCGQITSIAAIAALAMSASAAAGTVTLNYPDAQIASAIGVMDARYRISNTNWDQIIASDPNISGATIVQQANLGNHTALNGVLWDFGINYSPVAGWAFTLTKVSGGGSVTSPSTVQWTSPFNGTPFDRSYNGLEMFAVVGSLPSGITAMSMEATNLVFSAPGHTVNGSLNDLVTTNGLIRQWVYADFDLATTAWSLTGQLKGSFVGSTSSNLDERIKFDVKAAAITVVPAPGAAALIVLGGLVGLRRRRA